MYAWFAAHVKILFFGGHREVSSFRSRCNRKTGGLCGIIMFLYIFNIVILRKNSLLKHVIEGQIEGGINMIGKQGERCKQLLYNIKEKTGYWKLKDKTPDRTL
jgi:hypothetical protein